MTRWLEVGIGLVEVLKLVGIIVVICMAVGKRWAWPEPPMGWQSVGGHSENAREEQFETDSIVELEKEKAVVTVADESP